MRKKNRNAKMDDAKKKSEEKSSAEQVENKPDDLISDLKTASEGLLYTSESDAPFEPFVWKTDQPINNVTANDVLKFGNYDSQTKMEEKTVDDFFKQPTEIQDWYGDEEKAQVEKYLKLKELLTNRLKNLKVFRVGEVQIDIYIVGIDEAGNLAGVKTKAVET